jgi:hypothetical protein
LKNISLLPKRALEEVLEITRGSLIMSSVLTYTLTILLNYNVFLLLLFKELISMFDLIKDLFYRTETNLLFYFV